MVASSSSITFLLAQAAQLHIPLQAGQIQSALAVLSGMVPEFEHNTGRPLAAEPARSPA